MYCLASWPIASLSWECYSSKVFPGLRFFLWILTVTLWLTPLAGAWVAQSEVLGPSPLELAIRSYNYLEADELSTNGKPSIIPGLKIGAHKEFVGERFEGGVDVDAFFSTRGLKNSYFLIRESYIASSRHWSENQLTIGRRLQEWSRLDSSWGLGVWQPRSRWDNLAIEEMGLSGVFYSRKIPGLEVVAYLSPIFVPEQGSDYNIDPNSGKVTSSNPYDLIPPNQALLKESNPVPVRYTLNKPNIVEDIILKAGAGALVRIGRERGPWGRAAYGYKPYNQPLLSYDPFSVAGGEKELRVNVYPRFIYHHVATLEGGYESGIWGSELMFLGDFPVQESRIPIHVNQEVSQALMASLAGHVQYNPFGRGRMTWTGSYLKRWGGSEPDSGSPFIVTGAHSLFEIRYPYREAVRLSWEYESPSSQWAFGQKITYDFPLTGMIWSGELGYRPEKNWKLNLGYDLIGVGPSADSSMAETGGTNWLSRIRQTDRVRGEISYAF